MIALESQLARCGVRYWGMDEPSPPCLVYLFADQMLPKEGHWKHAMGEIALPVPGSNTLVSLGHLEQHLLAIALWDLDATDAIRLQSDSTLRRGRLRIDPGTTRPDLPGLEGQLLALLPADGVSLWDLIMDHWVTDHPMALNALVLEAQLEALDLGLIERPETPELIPGFFGHHTFPTVPVDEDLLASQQDRFDVLSDGWSQAISREGPARPLLKECSSVLYDARATGGLTGLAAWP